MIKQTRCGLRHFSFSKKGFSLIELALTMGVIAILLGGLSPSFIQQMYQQAGKKISNEIVELKKISEQYFKEKGAWPVSMEELKIQGYLHAVWDCRNPFNKAYEFVVEPTQFVIRCDVPLKARAMILAQIPMGFDDEKGIAIAIRNSVSYDAIIPTGTIIALATENIPEGWLLCDGREVDREEFAHLFYLMGTTYGKGDGITTFHLPDLRGRVVVGLDNMGAKEAGTIKASWAKTIGGVFGAEKHLLTIDEMPRHKHDTPLNINFGDSGQPAMETGRHYHANNYPSNYTGGDQPHNNIQPSMALNWLVKT